MKLLTEVKINKEEHIAASELFAEGSAEYYTVILLMGYLKYELLKLALMKRWRVNFHIDPDRKKMAVPFRAKDVPAKHTEFGHLGFRVTLTLLS